MNVKATKKNATPMAVPGSELWAVRIVTVKGGPEGAVTLLLAEKGTELKAIAKLDAPGKNLVSLLQVMRGLATKNIGVGCSVSKSKRVARWVQSLRVSWLLVRSLKPQDRSEMFVLSR